MSLFKDASEPTGDDAVFDLEMLQNQLEILSLLSVVQFQNQLQILYLLRGGLEPTRDVVAFGNTSEPARYLVFAQSWFRTDWRLVSNWN